MNFVIYDLRCKSIPAEKKSSISEEEFSTTEMMLIMMVLCEISFLNVSNPAYSRTDMLLFNTF